MPDRTVIRYRSAGGVVIDDHGRVLLIERHIDDRHEVRLPKGHVDPGETVEGAALREVCEETGYCDLELVADLGWRMVAFDLNAAHVIREEHFFLMALASQRWQTPEFADDKEALFSNRWSPDVNAAEAALTFEAEKDAVRRAKTAYEKDFDT
ncbi:MAG: NUDIX domain-containing protein [Chloroflexota bacterium]|nr:NUDIX domain-containing protein [Chloroflexota bacterium]